jgi:hypothetical protein
MEEADETWWWKKCLCFVRYRFLGCGLRVGGKRPNHTWLADPELVR